MINRRFLYFFVLFVLLVKPINIKASCTIQEKAKLKQIVSNINISYDYVIQNNRASFSLRFNNVNSQIYFKDEFGNLYYGNDLGEVILYNYPAGNSYTFDFYGVNACDYDSVGKLYATLPSYNPYYMLSVCDDAKEYSLCQKWVSHSLSRNEFIKNVNNYKNSINENPDDNVVDKDISIIDFVLNFIRMYGVYILIVITISIVTIKYIRYKKDSFGF